MEDHGDPALGDETSVTIRITEVGKPIFSPSSITVTRPEDLAVGTEILTVKANDPNPDVSFISLTTYTCLFTLV